jgi:plastocyanin
MRISKHGTHSDYSTVQMAMLFAIIALSFAPFVFVATPSHAATTYVVNMTGTDRESSSFNPASIAINVGDTITWYCVEGVHTTTSASGQAESWDSGSLMQGQNYSHTFTHAGIFTYSSTADVDNAGSVTVQQPSPEFPGSLAFVTVALAVVLALLFERKLRA